MQARPDGDDWCDVTTSSLPTAHAVEWATVPSCGAVVLFAGTVRDHAEGRPGVTALEYEAYVEQARPRMHEVADELRRRWPQTGRVVILHRVGRLELSETAVVVVVSAPHRDAAFDAARYAIDAVKATVPIWKREEWSGGSAWGTGANDLESARGVR
jgi:molybdopterin synthase catalytic subunit